MVSAVYRTRREDIYLLGKSLLAARKLDDLVLFSLRRQHRSSSYKIPHRTRTPYHTKAPHRTKKRTQSDTTQSDTIQPNTTDQTTTPHPKMPLTSTKTSTPPTHYLLTLYPGHQLLDSAGPLDILSMITKSPQGHAFTLTIVTETLDPIDLAFTAGTTWEWEDTVEVPRAADGRHGGLGFNPRLVPDLTFEGALRDLRRGGTLVVGGVERPVDVVLVPGGMGNRMFRVDKASGERRSNVGPLVDFLGELDRGDWVRCAWMTVCTGSDVLARTGLLDGRRATTNVHAFEKVKAKQPGVEWLEKRRWVRSLPGEVADGEGKEVIKREVWTGAGVSAGMDLMLWFVAEVWGVEFARATARRLEYEWRESVGEGERDPFYE